MPEVLCICEFNVMQQMGRTFWDSLVNLLARYQWWYVIFHWTGCRSGGRSTCACYNLWLRSCCDKIFWNKFSLMHWLICNSCWCTFDIKGFSKHAKFFGKIILDFKKFRFSLIKLRAFDCESEKPRFGFCLLYMVVRCFF